MSVSDGPDVVYHYTGMSGLMGILRSGTLWATDFSFLNDGSELVYALDQMIEARDELVQELRRSDAWESMQDGVLPSLDSNRLGQEWFVFVTCFCEEGDLLSQWRGYGPDNGYAIGYRRVLLDSEDEAGARLQAVRYGLDLQDPEVRRFLDWEVTPTAHPGIDDWERWAAVIPLLASYKDPAFSEEKEWRRIETRHAFPGAVDGVLSALHQETSFRPTDLGPVPYLEIKWPHDSLAEIVVGPGTHQRLRARGVERLLQVHDLPVEVRCSQIPLR